MAENTENAVNTPPEQRKVVGVPFTKDDPRINREGRPKGSNNFETDFDVAVEEIAKENGMTRSEARKLLLKVAFKQAKDGNYSFYKDIHDRIYGQPKNTNDIKFEIDGKIEIVNYADTIQLQTEGLPITPIKGD